MKKLILLFLLSMSLALPSMAQEVYERWDHQIGGDLGAIFPNGDYDALYNTGYSASFTYYYRPALKLFLSASVGYHNFPTAESSDWAISAVPILVGVRYNFKLTGVQPYIGAEFGGYIFSTEYQGKAYGDAETHAGLVPKAGLRIPITDAMDFDLNLRYNKIFDTDPDFSYMGLELGLFWWIRD